jgi:hypothetical protein
LRERLGEGLVTGAVERASLGVAEHGVGIPIRAPAERQRSFEQLVERALDELNLEGLARTPQKSRGRGGRDLDGSNPYQCALFSIGA